MKIAYFVTNLNKEFGWGRYSLELMKKIERNSVNIKIFFERHIKQEERAGFEGAPLLLSEKDNKFKVINIIRDFLRIRKNLRGVEMIHCLTEVYAPLAALISVFLKIPFVMTAHGSFAIKTLDIKLLGHIYKWSFKRAKIIFCISRFTEKELKKKIPEAKTVVINNGVDFAKFQRQIVYKKNDNKIIVGVGALKDRKGYHISILAVARIKEKYPKVKYCIVGNQDNKKYFEILKKLVKENDLEENVVFKSNLDDNELIDLFYKADVFVLTPVNIKNNFEGFGLVYLEASACGLPVIGARGCGAEDAIKNNETGLLVSQNDVNVTVEAILKILDSCKLSARLGREGKEFARSMDWDHQAKKYLEFYRKVI